MKTVTARRSVRPTKPDVHAESLVLDLCPDGRLIARVGEAEHVVHVTRCFPWSEPESFLSLRDDDGHEIALVADRKMLSQASREALEAALAGGDFVFDLTGVDAIVEEVELRNWQVRTAQGQRAFQTRLDDWPRTLPDGGLLIRDITGDLYRLKNIETLDRASRALLWAFIDC